MSQYTTGEIAKLAGVTVRTVQYYDTRGILVPNELTEGGRRLYNDADLRKLRVICFLRDLDIPINSINEILAADNAENVISVLLEQQLTMVKEEIAEKEKQRDNIEAIRREMKNYDNFSIENLNDIAYEMKNRKKMNQTRAIIFALGILVDVIEVGTLYLGFDKGIWWPFFIGLIPMIGLTVFAMKYYYKYTAYICPECHEVFKPSMTECFWANHTPTTRKVTCSACGHRGFCVEVYQSKEEVKGE